MENIFLLAVGVLMLVIGIVNMTGNVSTIHSYNRKKVREEDMPRYAMTVGIGTVIIALGIIGGSVLVTLDLPMAMPFVVIPAIAVGLALILFAQFKYNKGIF